MKCCIRWIDENGRETPDTDEAIAIAKCGFVKKIDPATGKWCFDTEKDIVAEVEDQPGLPICLAHAKKAGPYWFLFPLPGKTLPDRPREIADIVIARKPPPVVVQSIIRAFPKDAEEIIKSLRANLLEGYWSFERWGMYVGVEGKDGYIHS